jgi:hypothetical protein
MSNVNSSIKGRNGAIITYDNATVSSLGSYSLTGLVTFDNTSISAVKTVYITGIPYSAIPPTKANGWTGSAREWNSSYVVLRNQTITKPFWCNEDIPVTIIHTVEVASSGKYTLNCSGGTVVVNAGTWGGTSLTDSAESMTLKSGNPNITCSNSAILRDVKVKKIVVLYRNV